MTQEFNYLQFISGQDYSPNLDFVFNRTIRFIINDLLAILLIWAIFFKTKYVQIAFVVQAFSLTIILPLYYYFKLTFENVDDISGPLFSFIHRIIINPMLILLLIPAFFIQNQK